MRRHGPVIAHCSDSEDFPSNFVKALIRKAAAPTGGHLKSNIYVQGDIRENLHKELFRVSEFVFVVSVLTVLFESK